MAIRIAVVLFCLLMIGSSCMGQSYFAFRPFLGISNSFSTVTKDSDNTAPSFRTNRLTDNIELGAWIEYGNDDYALSAGYSPTDLIYGYRLRAQNIVYTTSTGIRSFQFPVKLSYKLKEVSLFPFIPKLSKEDQSFKIKMINSKKQSRYLIVFKPSVFCGFSWSYTPNTILEKRYKGAGASVNLISIVENRSIITQHAFALLIGGQLQFRHNGKDRLAFSLYFRQGLTKIMNVDLQYRINGEEYSTSLALKGTAVGFNISYPITLIRFNN